MWWLLSFIAAAIAGAVQCATTAPDYGRLSAEAAEVLRRTGLAEQEAVLQIALRLQALRDTGNDWSGPRTPPIGETPVGLIAYAIVSTLCDGPAAIDGRTAGGALEGLLVREAERYGDVTREGIARVAGKAFLARQTELEGARTADLLGVCASADIGDVVAVIASSVDEGHCHGWTEGVRVTEALLDAAHRLPVDAEPVENRVVREDGALMAVAKAIGKERSLARQHAAGDATAAVAGAAALGLVGGPLGMTVGAAAGYATRLVSRHFGWGSAERVGAAAMKRADDMIGTQVRMPERAAEIVAWSTAKCGRPLPGGMLARRTLAGKSDAAFLVHIAPVREVRLALCVAGVRRALGTTPGLQGAITAADAKDVGADRSGSLAVDAWLSDFVQKELVLTIDRAAMGIVFALGDDIATRALEALVATERRDGGATELFNKIVASQGAIDWEHQVAGNALAMRFAQVVLKERSTLYTDVSCDTAVGRFVQGALIARSHLVDPPEDGMLEAFPAWSLGVAACAGRYAAKSGQCPRRDTPNEVYRVPCPCLVSPEKAVGTPRALQISLAYRVAADVSVRTDLLRAGMRHGLAHCILAAASPPETGRMLVRRSFDGLIKFFNKDVLARSCQENWSAYAARVFDAVQGVGEAGDGLHAQVVWFMGYYQAMDISSTRRMLWIVVSVCIVVLVGALVCVWRKFRTLRRERAHVRCPHCHRRFSINGGDAASENLDGFEEL